MLSKHIFSAFFLVYVIPMRCALTITRYEGDNYAPHNVRANTNTINTVPSSLSTRKECDITETYAISRISMLSCLPLTIRDDKTMFYLPSEHSSGTKPFHKAMGNFSYHEVRANNCGGHLASIIGEHELNIVTSLLPEIHRVWLGGKRIKNCIYEDPEQCWKWTDGSSFKYYEAWHNGQPTKDRMKNRAELKNGSMRSRHPLPIYRAVYLLPFPFEDYNRLGNLSLPVCNNTRTVQPTSVPSGHPSISLKPAPPSVEDSSKNSPSSEPSTYPSTEPSNQRPEPTADESPYPTTDDTTQPPSGSPPPSDSPSSKMSTRNVVYIKSQESHIFSKYGWILLPIGGAMLLGCIGITGVLLQNKNKSKNTTMDLDTSDASTDKSLNSRDPAQSRYTSIASQLGLYRKNSGMFRSPPPLETSPDVSWKQLSGLSNTFKTSNCNSLSGHSLSLECLEEESVLKSSDVSWKRSGQGGKFKRDASSCDSLNGRSPPPPEVFEEDPVSKPLDISWKQRLVRGETFKREALHRGSLIVMSTPSGTTKPWEASLKPGTYNLSDLVQFPDINRPIPRHARICTERSCWKSSVDGSDGSSGTLIIDANALKTIVPVEIATSNLLNFYGCTLIDPDSSMEIELTDKHVIQNFTYSMEYFKHYANENGGLEVHDFAHIDCPLDSLERSGTFIIGKWNEDGDALLLTAFRVPQMHTLYIPGGVLHSNDYLLGTWRTMLSWTSEKPIDHVNLISTSKAALNIEAYSKS